jgi:hypothetical protein
MIFLLILFFVYGFGLVYYVGCLFKKGLGQKDRECVLKKRS